MSNPWESFELLLDKNKRPIPQLWDDQQQKFVPYTPTVASGSNSGGNTGGTTSSTPTYVAKEPFSGSANVTHTFTQSMSGFVISNDGASDLTFTIGTDTYTVKAGEVFEDLFNSFTVVTINSTVAFRAYGKMALGTVVVTPTPTVTVPSDVTNLLVGTISSSTVALSWTASSGATSYDVYQGTTLLGNVTSTSYTASGLSASTAYTFKVVAKNSAGSSTGVTVNATTSAPPVSAPADVTGLGTSNVTYNAAIVNWTASSGATSYDVYQGALLLGNTASTSYNVTGLSASTQYTFKVVAKNSAGSSAGVTTTVTTAVAPPADVTNLAASSITQTTLTLGWTASTGASSYDVYNGTTLLGNATTNSYNITGLTAGTAYTFKVIAKNVSGSSTGVTVNATTTVNAPADVTNLATSSVTQTTLTLGWTASATATSYDVYNGITLLGNVTTTSYNVTGLTASTAYTFKVVAKNAGGSSTGATVNVTTQAAADTTPPDPVTNLTAGTVTSSTIPVTWTLPTATDVANFEVAYSSNGGTTYTVASSVVNATSTSYTVTGLTSSTSYTIRVVAIDGAGNRSTSVTIQATTAIPPMLVSDSFNRADSTTTLGSTDSAYGGTNAAWQVLDGTVWGINTNRAYCVTPTGTSAVVVDTGVSDNFTLTVSVPVYSNSLTQVRVIWRAIDTNNYFLVQGTTVFRRQAGGFNNIGTLSGVTLADGMTYKIVVSGNTHTIYVNGVQGWTGTDAFNNTAKMCGLGSSSNSVLRYDDFKVSSN